MQTQAVASLLSTSSTCSLAARTGAASTGIEADKKRVLCVWEPLFLLLLLLLSSHFSSPLCVLEVRVSLDSRASPFPRGAGEAARSKDSLLQGRGSPGGPTVEAGIAHR